MTSFIQVFVFVFFNIKKQYDSNPLSRVDAFTVNATVAHNTTKTSEKGFEHLARKATFFSSSEKTQSDVFLQCFGNR